MKILTKSNDPRRSKMVAVDGQLNMVNDHQNTGKSDDLIHESHSTAMLSSGFNKVLLFPSYYLQLNN